jgi:hypothetical protein
MILYKSGSGSYVLGNSGSGYKYKATISKKGTLFMYHVPVPLMIPVWLHQNLYSFSLSLANETGINVANKELDHLLCTKLLKLCIVGSNHELKRLLRIRMRPGQNGSRCDRIWITNSGSKFLNIGSDFGLKEKMNYTVT